MITTKAKIDGRTRHAKAVKEIVDGLTDRPADTAKTILKRFAAENTVIADEIFKAAMNTGDLLDEKGELQPLIQKHLLRFQGLAKTALIEVLKLEGGAKPEADPEDLFNDVFEE